MELVGKCFEGYGRTYVISKRSVGRLRPRTYFVLLAGDGWNTHLGLDL